MKRRTLLGLLGGSSAAASVTIGSGAFSSTRADRPTEVTVVGDDNAYLTLAFEETQRVGCAGDVEVAIRNRTAAPLDTLELEFSVGAGSIGGLDTDGQGSYAVDPEAGRVSLEKGRVDTGRGVAITATVEGFSGTDTTEFGFRVLEASSDSVVVTTSARTVGLEYDCPTAPGRRLDACPVAAVGSPDIAVPASPCEPLEFAQAALPESGSIDLSRPPGDVREALGDVDGIDVATAIEETAAGGDRDDPLRVLSDDLSAERIEAMPDSPGDGQTFELGGSDPQARVGRTAGADVAVVDENVTLKNRSTVVGALEVGGTFKLEGGSAVAGDVAAERVEAVADSLLLGGLETSDGEASVSITGGAVVCGGIDAAGPLNVKQSRVDGPLRADGPVGATGEATVGGDVTTAPGGGGNVTVKSGSLVDGDVVADGDIGEISGSEVTGSVEAGGTVSTVKQSTVGGGVTADGGNVTVEESTVDGPVAAGGDIPAIKSGSEIGGAVDAAGTVSEIATSAVDGSVTAADVGQLTGVSIGGDVTATDGANEDITIEGGDDGSVVCGDVVSTDGRVGKIVDAKVDGSVRAAQVGALKGDGTEVGRSVRTTDDGADLSINAATVYGSVDVAGSVLDVKQARIEGGIVAGGKVNVNESSVCTAPGAGLETEATAASGAVNVEGGSTVGGPVDAAGPVEAIKGATVEGDVTTDGAVGEVSTATIEGGLTASDGIGEIKGSTVEGDVTAGGNVKITESDVCTDSEARLRTTDGGAVTVEGGTSTVGGPIDADGPVETIKNATVDGDVVAGGDVTLEGTTEIRGDVTANGGRITEGSDVTVTGTTTENP